MNRTRAICLGVSLLIHGSFIGAMNYGGMLTQWLQPLPAPKQEDKLMLEFVEVPESALDTEIIEETNVISDKTTEAKDLTEDALEDNKAKSKREDDLKQMPKEEFKDFKEAPEKPKKQAEPETKPEPEAIPVEEAIAPEQKQKEVKKEEETPSEPQMALQQQKKFEYEIVNLPEVSESIYSTGQKGQLTFQTKAHKIGHYFKDIKKKIEKYWLSYLVFKYKNRSPQMSETMVSFKILPNGEVTEVEVLEHEGDTLFKDFCMASVTNTAPFPPLPDDLWEEVQDEGGLNIVFTFSYK